MRAKKKARGEREKRKSMWSTHTTTHSGCGGRGRVGGGLKGEMSLKDREKNQKMKN